MFEEHNSIDSEVLVNSIEILILEKVRILGNRTFQSKNGYNTIVHTLYNIFNNKINQGKKDENAKTIINLTPVNPKYNPIEIALVMNLNHRSSEYCFCFTTIGGSMENILSLLPAEVFEKYQKLTPEQQQKFLYHFGKEAKDPNKAFLWFWFGVHYIYLGELGKQLLYWFTIGGAFVWFFIDMFTIKKKVQERNVQIALKALSLV